MRTAGSLDGLLRCSEHDCPMLRIGNQYECVIERVDAHLGGKRVKDILPGSQGTPFALINDKLLNEKNKRASNTLLARPTADGLSSLLYCCVTMPFLEFRPDLLVLSEFPSLR